MQEETLESESKKWIVQKILAELSAEFIGRGEEAKVAVLALISRNHAVMIGEPGVGKSAILRSLAERIGGSYYYYLLSKYTIPDEIIGPIDPVEYRTGNFRRMMKKRLPEANIAFIDEVFKGSSETLNTLLNIMNERTFVDIDGTIHKVPLISMFAASNELPQGDELQAFFDRILLKHFVNPVESGRIKDGILLNANNHRSPKTTITLGDLDAIYGEIRAYFLLHVDEIAGMIMTLVTTMRANGIFVSDRTAMGPTFLPMLVASYSWLTGSPVKKSTMEVAKYILQDNDEQLNAFNKALESIYPKELRDALSKLQSADDLLKAGNLGDAERSALEAVNMANSLVSKENMFDLYKAEITEFVETAQTRIKKIQEIKRQISGGAN